MNKPNPREEIRNRGNAAAVIDPRQESLIQEAAKIESEINGVATMDQEVLEPTSEQLELQAKALLSRAEQIKISNPALLPDQAKIILELRTHYLKLLQIGMSPVEANGLIQNYSGIAGFEAVLLRKAAKKA